MPCPALPATLGVVLALAGCASPPPAPPPAPAPPAAPTARVVLLPQPDGRDSALLVTAGAQSLRLAQPYAAAQLRGDNLAEDRASADEVQARYGPLLQLQPMRPQRFVVRFEANGSQLTADAKSVLDELRRALAALPAPEVVVIGHSDRVGALEANDRLSLRRAEAVRDILVAAGLRRELVSVAGRGEREPEVPTADEVPEPRNRRVEIKLR